MNPGLLIPVAQGQLDGMGDGAVTLPVLENPNWFGLSFYWQAILGLPLDLTNLEITTLTEL